jgi:membrane protease YdiL (CAAX protease family)
MIKLLYSKSEEYSTGVKLKWVFKTIGWVYLCVFLFILTLQIADIFLDSINLNQYKDLSKDLSHGIWWKNALAFLIVTPVIEELFFRLPILKHRYYLLIPIVLTLLSLCGFLITERYSFVILFIYSSYLFLLYFSHKSTSFSRNTVVLNVVVSSLIFGLLHLYNFKFEEVSLDSSGILYCIRSFTPLIMAGFGFAFIRLKLSVYWSMIAHSIYNFLPFIAITYL